MAGVVGMNPSLIDSCRSKCAGESAASLHFMKAN